MKEIIKKIIVGVLAVGIVVAAAVYNFVILPDKKNAEETDVSVSDVSEESTTNKPKKENNTKAEEESTEEESTEEVSGEAESTEVSENQTTSADNNTPVIPNADTTPTTTKAQQDNNKPTESKKPTTTKPQGESEEEIIDDTPVEEGNKIDPYQELFKSGKFLMKVSDPELGPVTMAMSGNKMFIEASMEGLTLKMVYNGDVKSKDDPTQGTWYIVIDSLKMYSPMPADMVGDMNVEELTKDFANDDSNTVYTASVEEINGELVDVESCVDQNGNTTKYYFNGDVLIRSDSISPNGSVSTTEFAEISAEVPDTLFQFPSNYKERDVSWLFSKLG